MTSRRIPDECEQNLLEFGQIDAPLPVPFSAYETETADLDGDGDLDIVAVGSGRGPRLAVFINASKREGKEAGGFAEPEIYETRATLSEFTTEDLDGDGDVDVAVAGRDSLSIYWNDGEGKLSEPIVSQLPIGIETFSAADLDGDGVIDLAFLLRSEGDPIAVLRNRGDGTFDPPRLFPVEPAGDDPQAIVCEDIDGDGDNDMVIVNRRSENVLILGGDGTGGFPSQTVVPLGEKASALAVADLDGNGLPDLGCPASSGRYTLSGNARGAASPALPCPQYLPSIVEKR